MAATKAEALAKVEAKGSKAARSTLAFRRAPLRGRVPLDDLRTNECQHLVEVFAFALADENAPVIPDMERFLLDPLSPTE